LSIYADTSFLVSLYLPDAHTLEAQRRITQPQPLWFSPLHHAEATHAILQQVFRGSITTREAQQILKQLEQDLSSNLWEYTDVPDGVFETCIQLARKHAARLGVRTLDTLHVASAPELKAKDFWTFDERKSKLAPAEGLKLLKP
jgi:predicted nucleic acid-binding protein